MTAQTSPSDLSTDFADLSGQALVTGGSGGLGAAIVRMLAQRGARVAFTWRSNRDAALALSTDVAAAGGSATGFQLDATDADASAALVGELVSIGGVHTLVHAAGPLVPQIHLSRVEPAMFQAQMEQEISGFFNVVQPVLPSLREQRGSIVAVTTAATHRYPVRDGLSPVAKGAVEQLVRGLAAEEGRFGVRANCVGPGMTDAGMAVKLDEAGQYSERDYAAATANIPLRSFGTAADVAEAVCFLASPRARYISGQYLAVDGGYTV